MSYLEPFGVGNSKPIFATKNISGISDAQLIGKDRNTLKFKIKSNQENFDVIGFQMIENYEKLLSNKNIDIAYSIEKNDWNGQQSLQFVLKDIVYSNG